MENFAEKVGLILDGCAKGVLMGLVERAPATVSVHVSDLVAEVVVFVVVHGAERVGCVGVEGCV